MVSTSDLSIVQLVQVTVAVLIASYVLKSLLGLYYARTLINGLV